MLSRQARYPDVPPGVLLALLVLTSVARAQQPASSEEAEVRRLEVSADGMEVPTVFIRPGLSTTLLFNAALVREGVELEDRGAFTRVEEGPASVSLVPMAGVTPGRRLLLRVRFADGRVPASAALMLEVSSARVDRQVEIERLPFSCESCARQLREARAEVQRYQENPPEKRSRALDLGGLTRLIADEGMNEVGVRTHGPRTGALASNSPFQVTRVISYRSSLRVAVVLDVQMSEGAAAWRVESAALTQQEGEALKVRAVWPVESFSSGMAGQLIVEAEAGWNEAQKAYELTLYEAGGNRTVILRNVTFP